MSYNIVELIVSMLEVRLRRGGAEKKEIVVGEVMEKMSYNG